VIETLIEGASDPMEHHRDIVPVTIATSSLPMIFFWVRVVVTDEIIAAMSLNSPFNLIHSNIHDAGQHRVQRVS
jgi:hypothetical protein